MIKSKKDNFGEHRSTAKVVDGNLILSLPDAINPIVWRMELGSVKASALEVRNGAEKGTSLLILKTPKGDVYEIAPYDSRDKAVAALMQVSHALQDAEGRMVAGGFFAPTANNNQPPQIHSRSVSDAPKASVGKWLLALFSVLIVIALFGYLGTLGAPVKSSGVSDTATVTGPSSGGTSGESGVPQSADDMLRGF